MARAASHTHGPVVALIACLLAQVAEAQLTASNLVRYQVIQRDSNSMTASFVDSGACPASTAKIQLRLSMQSDGSVVGAFGWKDLIDLSIRGTRWQATFAGLPVGGEYRLQLRALDAKGVVIDSLAMVDHLLVGDVWLCAGQSNMQQDPGAKLDTSFVHTRVIWASDPGAKEANPWGTTLTKGPSTSFGNQLHALTGIPVGLVYAAKGGTSLNDWFYSADSGLFQKMSRFLQKGVAGWKIGGFLWYQGENEDQQDTWASRYFLKFSRMRDTIRALSGNPKLPVVAVQLESWDGTSQFPLNPYGRWVRWPVTRDQQERIGRADSFSVCAPIWPAAGLHINGKSQALLGTYAAAKGTGKFYRSVAPDPGTGPVFRSASFSDSTRRTIVVHFDGVKGRLLHPSDPSHLGFYVMNPKVFDINDSTIFAYGSDSKGNAARMLKSIESIDTLGPDKVVIKLAEAPTDSVTIGYGRHIQLVSLAPLTDASGIPLPTFFNREIAPFQKTSSVDVSPVAGRKPILRFDGSRAIVCVAGVCRNLSGSSSK